MEQEVKDRVMQNIREAEKKLQEWRIELDRAKAAGVDVSDLEQRYQDLLRRVAMLKAVYGR
jgi:hypothetical protein